MFMRVNSPPDAPTGFKDIRCELILLGGTKSPKFLQTSVAALAKVFPRARLVTFQGLGHEASGNANQWGKPEQVARELRAFFREKSAA
jgi:hypothetical protein